MKSIFLLFLFLVSAVKLFSQISEADCKKISKIVGEDFILLPNQKVYPYCGYSGSLPRHSSTADMKDTVWEAFLKERLGRDQIIWHTKKQDEVLRSDTEKINPIPGKKTYPCCGFSSGFQIDISTTYLNDTIGVSFQNEHLLWHDLISFSEKDEVLKLAKPTYISVAEYLEFQNYVRDSIARDHIYLNEAGRTTGYANREWTDEMANKWINYKEKYYNESSKEYWYLDPHDRQMLRSLFHLNWDQKLNYEDPAIIPLVADMYLPQPERVNRLKEFDQRKLFYTYQNDLLADKLFGRDSMYLKYPFIKVREFRNGKYGSETYGIINRVQSKEVVTIENKVATLYDNYSWAQCAELERDEYSVLAHVYPKLFTNLPMIGVNNPQAKAFCHWKQELLQKEFDKNGLPYVVVLTLPTREDQQTVNTQEAVFHMKERDYTAQWKITNKEYSLFVKYVQDSILKDGLYDEYSGMKSDEKANKLLNYSEMYFDEGTYEYTMSDPSDRILARALFSQNPSFNFKSLNSEGRKIMDSIKRTKQYVTPAFKYYYLDSKEKSIIGTFCECNYCSDPKTLLLSTPPQKITRQPLGKDLNLGFTSVLRESSGVRSHENFQRFIVRNAVPVLSSQPIDLNQPDALIQTITYEQARAFYYWKYPIHNPDPKDDWQKFVLPTKEQFEAVQQGKQVIVPEKKVAYPTPLFRYVVHVYPK